MINVLSVNASWIISMFKCWSKELKPAFNIRTLPPSRRNSIPGSMKFPRDIVFESKLRNNSPGLPKFIEAPEHFSAAEDAVEVTIPEDSHTKADPIPSIATPAVDVADDDRQGTTSAEPRATMQIRMMSHV